MVRLLDIEEEPVRQHFSVCGAVTNVRVVHDRKTGAGKGFGYITFVVMCVELFCRCSLCISKI